MDKYSDTRSLRLLVWGYSYGPAAGGPAPHPSPAGPLSTLARMKLDGNQASIREAIDAGLLAGAVTLVWRAGQMLQVNELGYRDVDAGCRCSATRFSASPR